MYQKWSDVGKRRREKQKVGVKKKPRQYFKALKLAKNTEGAHTFCSGDIPRARVGYHTEKKISFFISLENCKVPKQKKIVLTIFFLLVNMNNRHSYWDTWW